jgi:Ala-tRNA(Pro) deacylase
MKDNAAAQPAEQEGDAVLFERLAALGIATRLVEHPAVFTVAESSELERSLPGGHTKNLFLKDDKGRLVLVIAESSTRVDVKSLSKKLGAGRFSFGKPELLMDALGVTPGSVNAFAVMNDGAGRIQVVFDRNLMAHETVNCHPMRNTATTNIAREDLLRFIRESGHEPRILELEAPAPAEPPA